MKSCILQQQAQGASLPFFMFLFTVYQTDFPHQRAPLLIQCAQSTKKLQTRVVNCQRGGTHSKKQDPKMLKYVPEYWPSAWCFRRPSRNTQSALIGRLSQTRAGSSHRVSTSAPSVFLQPQPCRGRCWGRYRCDITTLWTSWWLDLSHSFWKQFRLLILQVFHS